MSLQKLMQRIPRRYLPQILRLGFNWHPAYRRSGGRIIYVADDLTLMRVRLDLSRRTRNLFGSLFGGSLFACTDGPHPTMIVLALGENYLAWDKNASIRFRRPAYGTVFGDCCVSAADIAIIKNALRLQGEVEHRFIIELKDHSGEIHAIIERNIYIAENSHFHNKRSLKN